MLERWAERVLQSSQGGLVFCMHQRVDARSTRAIGAVVARFVHTEEVTGSNPVSPTKRNPRISGGFFALYPQGVASIAIAKKLRM